MVVRLKINRELSDTPNTFYYDITKSVRDNISQLPYEQVNVEGDELVKIIYGRPLSEVVGCSVVIQNRVLRANYLFSEQTKREGRAKAYNYIATHEPCPIENIDLVQLESVNQLGNCVSFDIETGGKSGIRCICFASDKLYYMDLRSKTPEKIELLKQVFLSERKFIAHNAAHDVGHLCKYMGIDFFPVWKDTISMDNGYEFRSLQYLTGVVLGVNPYKHELQEANESKDFNKLVAYCGKDALYSQILASKIRCKQTAWTNQFIRTIIHPPKLKLKQDLFAKYPQFVGMTKKQLKQQLNVVESSDVQLLLQTITPSFAKISYHTGVKTKIPKGYTVDGDMWYRTFNGESVHDAMLHDVRFYSAELSAERFVKQIVPTKNYGEWNVNPKNVVLINDVCCLVDYPAEGFKKCNWKEVKELFDV